MSAAGLDWSQGDVFSLLFALLPVWLLGTLVGLLVSVAQIPWPFLLPRTPFPATACPARCSLKGHPLKERARLGTTRIELTCGPAHAAQLPRPKWLDSLSRPSALLLTTSPGIFLRRAVIFCHGAFIVRYVGLARLCARGSPALRSHFFCFSTACF